MMPSTRSPQLGSSRQRRREITRFKAAQRRLARPRLESLEERTLLTDASSLLQTLQASANTATSLGSNLASGALGKDLPILSGGASALDSILGVSSTFSGIGSTLGGLSPSDIVNAGAKAPDHATALQDEENALQSALGSGYTVNTFSDSEIQITFTKGLSGNVNNLSTTTNAADFFGGAFSNDYFSDLTGLAGTATGKLASGGNFNIVFGADGTGFFVKSGSLMTSPEFSVTLPLTADHLKISNDVFEVGIDNTSAKVDLKSLDLSLSQDVRSATPGSAASFSVDGGSTATLTGDLSLKVLNQDLVTWSPTLTWSFNTGTGAVTGAPSVSLPGSGSTGAPAIVDGAESAIQSALAGSLGGALGLDKLGVVLGPLASGLQSLQDFINDIGSALGDGIDNGGINPEALLDAIKGLGNFQFFPGNDLQDVVMGKAGATIVSLNTGMHTLASTPTFNPHFPVGVISLLGIINLIPELGVSFHADTSAELGFGIDTSGGVFIDTKNTDLDFTTKFGADFKMDVNVLGAFDDAAYFRVGPNVSAIAKLSLNPNGGTADKLYLSKVSVGQNLNQSDALPALGSWLSDLLHLDLDFKGDIGLTVGANIGPAAIVNDIPEPAATFVKSIEGVAQYVFDFINKVADTVCDVIDVIPLIGPAFESLVNCHDVARYTSVLFGDLEPVFKAAASTLDATYSEPEGLGSFQLDWDFPVVDVPIHLTGAKNINPTPDNPANQSPPTDYISYSVLNGKLTINGKDGPDQIQVVDAGGGQITLKRSGQEPNGGPSHTDPDVTLSGITSIEASLGGGDDSFTMDGTLNIPATVHGGDGNDTITTGKAADTVFGDAGDDTIHGGDGNDTLDGGDGNDHIYGDAGDDTIFGSAGDDDLHGGDNNDTIHGGDGSDTIHGDAGNDKLFGDGGDDTIYGDADNDTLYSGDGSNHLYGGDGADKLFSNGAQDPVTHEYPTNYLFGDAGSDELHSGSGPDILHGGDDNDTLIGGGGGGFLFGDAGNDLIYGARASSLIQGTAYGGAVQSFRFGGSGDDIIKAGTGDDLLVGGADNDILIFDNASVPNAPNLPRPPVLVSTTGANVFGGDFSTSDPGQDGDFLSLFNGGGDSFNETYTIGAQNRTGSIVTTDGVVNQTIHFWGIKPAVDVVPVHSLTVVADGQPNNIRIFDGGTTLPGASDDGDTGSLSLTAVAIDDRDEMISFANKPILTVQAMGGDDNVSLDITTPATGLLHTIVDGGDGFDTFSAVYRADFGARLDVENFENITSIAVQGNLSGTIVASSPGNVTSFSVGQSITSTGLVQADSITTATIGQDLAGTMQVAGAIGALSVAGSMPSTGSVTAGSIDTMTIGPANQASPGHDLAGQVSVVGSFAHLSVAGDVSGLVTESMTMQSVFVGGSIASTGQILATSLVDPTLGNIVSLVVLGGVAGFVFASGALSDVNIGGDLSGVLQESLTIQNLFIGGSMTAIGQVLAQNGPNPSQGNITTMVVVANMAGLILVTGTLTRLSVGGDVSGTVEEEGIIDNLSIGGSLTSTGFIQAVGSPASSAGINNMTVGKDLAGQVVVSGTLLDLTVDGDVSGSVQEAGVIDHLFIGGSLTSTGVIQAVGNPPASAGINNMTVVEDLAGRVIVSGTLHNLSVGGDVSGSVQEAGIIDNLYIGGSLTPTGLIQAIGNPPASAGITLMTIVKNLAGRVIVSGTIQDLNIVSGEMTNTGVVNTAELVLMTIGPDALSPGQDMAGRIQVSDTLTELRVAGGTPGTIVAGYVGTVRAYGGYGPLVLQIKEAGTQRRVELAVPSNPYPILPAPPAPTSPASPGGVLVRYEYESGGLPNPQWTGRVTNTTGNTAPDQYDLSLVVWSDTAKFNLARLDATGVSGIRNVAVEGDVLQSVTPRASSFFVLPGGSLDNTPAGVRLPQDNLAGVGVRDFLPAGFIQAASLQALGFGSFIQQNGTLAGGDAAQANDAERLLASPTAIAQAKDQEIFRVPFADGSKVGFFLNTQGNGHFDPQNIVFTDQSNADQVTTDLRGAVTALVQAALTFQPIGMPSSSVVQAIDLHGDAGAIQTQQQITKSVTSSGPLGDFIDQAAGGIVASITSPSIVGSIIAANGPISSTIQTTGLRTEPTTGVQSFGSAAFGRLSTDPTSQMTVATTVQAEGGGLSSTGRLISRGDLISQVKLDGGIDGTIAAQGNLGAASSDLSTRYGGILTGGGLTGQVVALGDILGDILITGQATGRIAAKGQPLAGLAVSRTGILGNLQINGGLALGGAIVSGGEIGDAIAGTMLSLSKNKGFVAAKGAVNGAPGGTIFARTGSTGPNASAIDAIFTDGGLALAFDLSGFDLAGLALILQDLGALTVGTNGQLTGTKA